MNNKYALSFFIFLLTFYFGFGQGSETFTNLNAAPGSYGNGSYTGDNGVTWTYNRGRSVTSTDNITGRSIGFEASNNNRNVSASSGINGVGDVTYSVRSYFTGGNASNRTMELWVNGSQYDTFTLPAMGTVYTRSNIVVNETGDVTIEFRSTGSRQIVLDDVSWTATSSGPNIGASPSALNNLDYASGSGPSAEQTIAVTGNNLTNPITINAPSNFEVSNTSGSGFGASTTLPIGGGTLYVRLAAGLGINTYSGNITLSSTGASTVNVSVNGEVTANVVITEIMYNTPGTNDYEWIEICNFTGIAQDVSNYTIDVNGNTRFTFAASATIPANDCITVLIGHTSSSPSPDCPFTPDYQNPVGTTDFLFNNAATIELIASNGTSIVDLVAYDDGDSNATDGNGSTFHVVDPTLDNSDTCCNWQAVPDGGSPGINSLTSPCTVVNPEINVEGDIGTFPDISDGDTTPSGTDNTLFATIPIGNNQTKSFRIQNVASAGDLIITDITLTGANPGDFLIDPSLTFPITIAPANLITFDITFSPTASGTRNATVEIANNDLDENPYNFAIRGTGSCASTSFTMSPTSGPAGTIVTITGSDYGGSTTATFGTTDITASINVLSSTQLELTIPSGVGTSFLEITDELGCSASDTFIVLEEDITSCEGSSGSIPSGWTGLMISGLFDNSSGSCHYLELFNPTGSAINLSGYNLRLANNTTDVNSTFGYTSSPQSLSGTIAAESTFMIQFGNTGSTCSDCPNITPDIVITDSAFGINGITDGAGGIDRVILLNGTTELDMVANTNYDDAGYVYQRSTTATAPQDPTTTTYTSSDWTSQGTADCFGFQIQNFVDPPLVTLNPSATTSCDLTATLNVAADEGFNGSGDSQELAYQWYFHAPGDSSWTAVTNNATYSGATTALLTINNVLNTIDYQFYCQIREDDATCYSSSEATRLDVQRVIWNGTWSGTPSVNTIVVISDDYNTSIGGVENQISFEACNLVVDAAVNLTVANSDFIRVVNNVVNNGNITVQTEGAFVQDGLGVAGSGTAGTFVNNGTARVIKQTSDFFDDGFNYHYTYWSSPVANADITTVFPNPRGNRRYYFDSAQYIDTDGDDISDTANDWQVATGPMEVGRGYAVTATTPPGFPYNNTNTFIGEFNTGDLPKSIVLNGFAGDNDWNFIGNPYPSAIDFEELYAQNNSLIEGAAFLWSQSAPPDISNPGNEVLNFNTSDYAIITANSGNTAGGAIGLPPTDFIPSGQGFFVRGILGGMLQFRNDMRSTGNNDIFYAPNDQVTDQNGDQNEMPNRLWLDLTSDNGIFSQILIAYVDGGTDGFDDWSYDAPRNLSTGTFASFYSIIEDDTRKFAIQGKNPQSLSLEETIELGFINSINEPTLYKISIPVLEGDFMENNTIYLKDNLLNTVHNLSDSDYNFTSEVGVFDERFEIVFELNPLSTDDFTATTNDLIIVDLNSSEVKFKINGSHSLEAIKIIDLLGRTLYYFDDINASDGVFNLSNLSQATYIAEVTLNNGQVISKKAVKRK